MRRLGLGAILLTFTTLVWPGEDSFVLTRQQWNVPRSVSSVLQMPALYQAMQRYHAHPDATLRLRYPGGDEGTLWAMEVRSWLISLGLASTHIELRPGSRDRGALEIEVVGPTMTKGPTLSQSDLN